MIILGIESTAHTLGVGIIKAIVNNSDNSEHCEVLSNEYQQYTSPNTGMKPDDIKEHHNKYAEHILRKSLETAKIEWKDIDAIAYSAGPGIDPILWIGYHKALDWSKTYSKPLIPVNHCCAHLSIGKIINQAKDPAYLYVSGVNTQVIVQDGGKYRIMGETLDIGLGNMLDKLGRILGLGFPAGPDVEKLAKTQTSSNFIELPYTVKGMDISFSGLLTKCQQLFEQGKATKKQICYSVQETAFAACCEVAERAMAATKKDELILVGGVGANKRFCQMLETMCKERNAKFFKVPMSLAGDQGAMIAWEGFKRKNNHPKMDVNCRWRTDEV
ncbi:UGMP family protein [archaeon]|nr:UGMP family protein [archaeon]|tara:strand:+ start:1213 stop:2199 length:987 start_codon:yes stop_codon:yes gene_type:complete